MLKIDNSLQKEAIKDASDANKISDVRTIDDESFIAQSMPILENLEGLRKVMKIAYIGRKKLGFFIGLAGLPIAAFIDYLLITTSSDDGGFGAVLAFCGGLYWWITQPKRQYAKEYKIEILPRLVGLFGDFKYDVDGKIDMAEMQPSKVVPSHSRYKSEDYFAGSYKGVNIKFSEITLKERRGSGKNKRTVQVFKGLSILLEMQKKSFMGHTILDKDKGKIGEWMAEKTLKLDRANLVDPKFEDIFDAYTNDQVEARYLVDPLIMQRLIDIYDHYASAPERDQRVHKKDWVEKLNINLKRSLLSGFGRDGHSNDMKVAFFNSKILIMIESNFNHFEPASVYVPATDPQSILHMKKEIADILSLIDQLDAYDPQKEHEKALAPNLGV